MHGNSLPSVLQTFRGTSDYKALCRQGETKMNPLYPDCVLCEPAAQKQRR